MIDIAKLKRRAEIVREIRSFFDEDGFTEVTTPVRIAAPAPEEHIDCPCVVNGNEVTYLRASPELQMKKLLALGMDKIYQIGPCFREGEKGSRHNPEFTMIEWYRLLADYRVIMEDAKRLLARFGLDEIRELDVREAYREFADWDPWLKWDQDRFDFDMAVKIEPAIKKMGGGVFLVNYPREASSLAVTRDDYAERWELYWDGMELANCFTELCDSDEQLARFECAKGKRKLLKEADYPIDYEFIECIKSIGSASGVALGIDRFVMVLTESKSIDEVIMIK